MSLRKYITKQLYNNDKNNKVKNCKMKTRLSYIYSKCKIIVR